MARYKDVENIRKLFDNEYKSTRKLINEGETHLDNLAEGFSEATRVLDMIPIADVVLRSDFNRLQGQVNRLKKYDEERDIKLHARLISETEIKVTREIFNEIEGYIKHLRKYQYCNEPLAYVFHIFDEAKKKHIGE